MTQEKLQQTIGALMDNEQVPVNIRHWLERYVSGDKHVLSHSFTEQEDATMEQARFIYAVLRDQYQTNDAIPEAARDLVEEYLYQLAEAANVQVWNYYDAAIAVLPVLLDVNEHTDSTAAAQIALAGAVKALCTKQEYSAFAARHNLAWEKEEPPTDEASEQRARDYEAALKCARVLADPRTPEQTRRDLGAALVKLATCTRVHVDHPALCERAASIMFENVDGEEARRVAAYVHELLAGIAD